MYIDDDIQFPVLTPNILMHRQPITIPEEESGDDDDEVIKKRSDISYIVRTQPGIDGTKSTCVLWHNIKTNQRHIETAIGDAVLIKENNKHRGKWNIGIIM